MKKRISTFALAVLMLLCAIPAAATETTEPTIPERAPGFCGETIVWDFSGGVLTISGTGAMDDFPEGAPWSAHKSEIKTVIISGGITYIGAYSFSNYDSLTQVEFGSDIREIGERAFFSCDGLTSVHLPRSFICFGPGSFMACSNLKEFHCDGVCPHFRLNCLRDTYGIIYYPAERPWPLNEIINLEEAFHGRIEFLASDGTDPYEPDPAETEPPTEPAPPVETEAPTEPPAETEAPTEETTEPAEEPTEEPTTVPPTTAEPTEEVTVEVTEPAPTATDDPTTAPTEEIHAPAETKPEADPPKIGGRILPTFIVAGTAAALFIGSAAFLLVTLFSRKRGK